VGGAFHHQHFVFDHGHMLLITGMTLAAKSIDLVEAIVAARVRWR
jgi:hypothetical protein